MKTVQDLMISKLQVLTEHDSLAQARELMRTYNIRNIPIVEKDTQRFVGLISQRDMLKETFSTIDSKGMGQLAAVELATPIRQVMVTDVITTTASTPLITAGHYCMENKHGCLPVLDDQGKLIGIVTPSDFVKLCVQLLETQQKEDATTSD